MRDIFLRCDNVSQFDSFVLSANLAVFFAPCLTRVFVPPYTDPKTQPHIQESDVLVSCRLNFWYYYSHFCLCALWNVVPSRPFSLCSWHDQPNLSRCARLFPNICNWWLSELIDPLMKNYSPLMLPSGKWRCSPQPSTEPSPVPGYQIPARNMMKAGKFDFQSRAGPTF